MPARQNFNHDIAMQCFNNHILSHMDPIFITFLYIIQVDPSVDCKTANCNREPFSVASETVAGARRPCAPPPAPPASRDCLREESKTCGSLHAKHFTPGRAGPARRRATRRSRVGTPLPVPKRSVPTRLRRVAHSNGRAIRLGVRTAVNAGHRRRRATRRSRVGTPQRRAQSGQRL